MGWDCWWWWGGRGVIGEQCKQVRKKWGRTGRKESEETTIGVTVGLRKTSGGMTARLAVWLVGWLIRWEAVSLAGWIQGLLAAWLTDWISDQQACLLIQWPAAWQADWLTRRLTGVKVGWLSLWMASWLSVHSLFTPCIWWCGSSSVLASWSCRQGDRLCSKQGP